MSVVARLESQSGRQPRGTSAAVAHAAAESSARVGYAPYLEGLRGLAALYVVLHHAALQSYDTEYDSESLSGIASVWLRVFDYGDLAVALFIVLSGYCLMLPVAQTGQIRGGWRGFFRRRAQRILPAYYAALALVLGALWIAPPLNEPSGARWDLTLPALDAGAIASHLLLVHNFHSAWIWKINGPLWSVAVECQLYLLFPLLCALFAKLGVRGGCAAGMSLAVAATLGVLVLDAQLALSTCPWYLGLFALGMSFALSPPAASAAQQSRGIRLLLGALSLALAAALPRASAGSAAGQSMLLDLGVALLLGSLLSHVQARACARAQSRLRRLLETPRLIWLGSFSYCLYLVHDPLLSFLQRALLSQQLNAEMRVWAQVLIGVPLATLCAYGLSSIAERPFLPRRPPSASRQRAGVALGLERRMRARAPH